MYTATTLEKTILAFWPTMIEGSHLALVAAFTTIIRAIPIRQYALDRGAMAPQAKRCEHMRHGIHARHRDQDEAW